MRSISALLAVAMMSFVIGATAATAQSTPDVAPQDETPAAGPADLGALKTYMVGNADLMAAGVADLVTFAQTYYDLAASVDFDYQALWDQHGSEVLPQLEAARVTWSEEGARALRTQRGTGRRYPVAGLLRCPDRRRADRRR